MISRLSDLLRLTFDRSRRSRGAAAGGARVPAEVPRDRTDPLPGSPRRCAYDIDPDTLDAEVPRLILQPLVENAIQHGIAPRSGPGHRADQRAAGTRRRLWLRGARRRRRAECRRACAAAQRHRPREHARPPRLSLRRRHTPRVLRTSGPGLAVASIEIPPHDAPRAATRTASHAPRARRRRAGRMSLERGSHARRDRRRRAAGAASGCGRCSTGRSGLEIVGECQDGTRRHRRRSAAPSRTSSSSTCRCRAPTASTWSTRSTPEQLPLVVFVTAFDHYALKAFDVHALDYLLKPFDRDRFLQALARARAAARAPGQRRPRAPAAGARAGSGAAAAAARAVRDQVRRPRLLRPRRRDRLDRGGRQLRQAARRRRHASVPRDDERGRSAAARPTRSTASTAATS